MEFLLVLLIVLVAARGCGEVAVRVGLPGMVGEIVAGIVLASVAGTINGVAPAFAAFADGDMFRAVLDLAIFFLMLLAGIEMRPEEITGRSRRAFAVALGGLVVPLGLGVAVGLVILPMSPLRDVQALFIGVALSITAVPATIRMLMDLGQLHSRTGEMIVAAAIFDDVLGFVLLAALTAAIGTGALPGVDGLLPVLGKVVLFFAIVTTIGAWLLAHLGAFVRRMKGDEAPFAALLILALLYALLAELLGMHFIIGAFAAGLYFGRQTMGREVYDRIKDQVSAISAGFLAPVFFASIGFRADLSVVTAMPWITALLIAMALLGKFIGAGVPAYSRELGLRGAMAVGAGMNVRGAVELIVADVALRAGLFAVPGLAGSVVDHLFSAVVVMAVVTTLLAPVALRALMPPGGPRDGEP